jgi:hypothetical protein
MEVTAAPGTGLEPEEMALHLEAAVDLVRRRVVLAGTLGLSFWSSKMFGLEEDPFAFSWPDGIPPFNDATGRTLASATLNPGERTGIFWIDGQSLAGSHIPGSYTVLNPTKIHCVNWAGDRLLYQHQEPMMGGSFYPTYVSLWGSLGDLLIARGTFDRIIWGNGAVAGCSSGQLAPGGTLGHRVPVFFSVLRSLGISGNQVMAIISMEGEADSALQIPPEIFKANRRATLRAARSFGFTGPMFIPVETWRGAPPQLYPIIQQAQAELATEAGFLPGPNFDSLGLDYRDATLVHQNALGRVTMAQMWCDTISAHF